MTKIDINQDQIRMARIAKALAHPTRVAIMYFLANRQECYFGAIHDIFNISKPTVSQHLKELKEAGLITGETEPPKVRYCINTKNWVEAQKLFAGFFNLCQCSLGEECHCHS